MSEWYRLKTAIGRFTEEHASLYFGEHFATGKNGVGAALAAVLGLDLGPTFLSLLFWLGAASQLRQRGHR